MKKKTLIFLIILIMILSLIPNLQYVYAAEVSYAHARISEGAILTDGSVGRAQTYTVAPGNDITLSLDIGCDKGIKAVEGTYSISNTDVLKPTSANPTSSTPNDFVPMSTGNEETDYYKIEVVRGKGTENAQNPIRTEAEGIWEKKLKVSDSANNGDTAQISINPLGIRDMDSQEIITLNVTYSITIKVSTTGGSDGGNSENPNTDNEKLRGKNVTIFEENGQRKIYTDSNGDDCYIIRNVLPFTSEQFFAANCIDLPNDATTGGKHKVWFKNVRKSTLPNQSDQNRYLQTGSIMEEWTNNEQTLVARYIMCVVGDVNSDGRVTFLDDVNQTNLYYVGLVKAVQTLPITDYLQQLAANSNWKPEDTSEVINFTGDVADTNEFYLSYYYGADRRLVNNSTSNSNWPIQPEFGEWFSN